MLELILRLAILGLIPAALGMQLLSRLYKRSGIKATPLWIGAHIVGGIAIFGLARLILVELSLPEILIPPGLSGIVFHVGFVELAKLLMLLVLARVLAEPACDCSFDDDDPPPGPVLQRKSSWDPFYSPPPEPWHGPTAAWTLGGFLLGSSYSVLENWTVAGSDLTLLILRQAGPMILHGATAALLAWSLARFRAGHRIHPLRAVIGAILIHVCYNLLVSAGFPWPLLSWLLIPPSLVLLWNYAGDSKPRRRQRKQKG